MLHITTRKITAPLCLCVLSLLFTSSIALAESDTGSIAATRAAEQREALAKKAADRAAKKAAAETKSAVTPTPAPEASATEKK